MQMQIRTAVFAVSMLSLVACQEDLSAEKKSWEDSTAAWQTKIDKLSKDQAALLDKAKNLMVAEGDAAMAAEKANVDSAVQGAGAAIDAVKAAISGAKTSIDAAITAGKKAPLQAALSTATGPIDGALAKAQSAVDAAGAALDAATTKFAAAKTAADSAAADKAKAEKWAADLKTAGATVEFAGFAFNGDNIDAEKSKDALAALQAAFSAPGFKGDLEVTGAAKHSRGDSLKVFLASRGAKASVGKVKNTVGAEESVKVTVVSPAK